MKLLILYWTLLQSTLSSFSGLTSLPVIRHELVMKRGWIDDTQLSAAVIIGRSTPGPMAVYVVCIGYFVAGYPGASMGLLALATPALLIVLLMRMLGTRVDRPRVKNAIRYVILGGAGFSAATLIGMGRSGLSTWWLAAIAVAACAMLLRTKVATLWILAVAGLISVAMQRGDVF